MSTGKHAETKEAPTEQWGRPAVSYPERENKPDLGIAYILLLLGGMLGLHRIYGDPQSKSGFVMLIMTLSVVGILVTGVWWIVDLFLLPGYIREATR